MCGLASITLDKTVGPSIAAKLDRAASALLEALDHRGGDACGILSIRPDGRITIQKAPCDARVFNTYRHNIPTGSRAIAVHTRMATQGHEAFNRNNHPVASGAALVMHNGMVWDDAITRHHGDPEVDTFALALVAADTPRKPDKLTSALARVEGSAAVIIAHRGAPWLYAARIDGSPLYVAQAHGVRITASTTAAVQAAANALGIKLTTEPYTYAVTTKKAKKGRPAKTETRHGTRTAIRLAAEGEHFTWSAGAHTAGAVKLPQRARYVQQAQQWETYPTHRGMWSDEERYGIGTTSHTYETIARKLLDVPETFERCDLCDEMTESTERWHGCQACAECRTWYTDTGATEHDDDPTIETVRTFAANLKKETNA